MTIYKHSNVPFYLWLFVVVGIVFVLMLYINSSIPRLKVVPLSSKKYEKNLQILHPRYSNTGAFVNKTFLFLWYTTPSWFPKRLLNNVLDKCDFRNCIITTDKFKLNETDVVLFHHTTMDVEPPFKRSNQKWVFITFESPYHTKRYYLQTKWENKFDWTASHRPDSEGFSRAGVITKRRDVPKKNYSEVFKLKSKEIAWVVSHCSTISRRELYVKKMKSILDVDIFGFCGNHSCPSNNLECKKNISKQYKFYLSFENSLCKNYLTEKVFQIYMNGIDMIPVVRGAPNARDILPIGTYISASEFNSPFDLAKYLKNLGSDPEKYISLLKEKDRYLCHSDTTRMERSMCRLCRLLNENTVKSSTLDLNMWIWKDQCSEPSA